MNASSSGSRETLDRVERMRSKAVYRSMLKLIDNDTLNSRTRNQPPDSRASHMEESSGLWKSTRCMSGAEFQLAIEERILAGYCGYPGCPNHQATINTNESIDEGYCSVECVQGVRQHVSMLGTVDSALKRFTALYELAKKERNLRLGKQDTAPQSSNIKGDSLAAGTQKTPIMQAVVREREPLPNTGTPGGVSKETRYDADNIEGYRLNSKEKRKKVQFADTCQEKGDMMAQDLEKNSQQGPAKFVFEIEDPKGPIDDDLTSLSDAFGTLKMVQNDGELSVEHGDGGGIDEELARTMREGASKYFPHLEACMPKEIWESSLDTSDSDKDDDEVSFLSDGDLDSSSDDDDAQIRCHMTFFTQLFSFFDMWITDYTIEIVQMKPMIPYEERKCVPQIPEVMSAMERFISIACKTLVTQLNAEHDTQSIREDISKVIHSFRMDQSLPAFQSKQWVIVCLVIFKALSLTARPEYQEYTDTRKAIIQVSKILSDANFTVEEFYAVLDLFLSDIQDK